MTLIKPIAMLKSKFSTINPMIALFVTLDQIPSTTRRITRMNITAKPVGLSNILDGELGRSAEHQV
ncbi:MAG: hypothetical protein U0N53_02865 [Ruthenibacterium sp.]|nr:hypothetical protein [Ruthenibacterium sp.]